MSSFSILTARYLEQLCDIDEPQIVQKKVNPQDSLLKRKITKLLPLLLRYQNEEEMTQKEMKSTIQLLREIIPHVQKKEQALLQKVYESLDEYRQ